MQTLRSRKACTPSELYIEEMLLRDWIDRDLKKRFSLDLVNEVPSRMRTTQANYATINYAANATISGVSTAMMMGNGTVQAFQFNDRSQPTGCRSLLATILC